MRHTIALQTLPTVPPNCAMEVNICKPHIPVYTTQRQAEQSFLTASECVHNYDHVSERQVETTQCEQEEPALTSLLC